MIARTTKTNTGGETITMVHVPLGQIPLFTELISVKGKDDALAKVNTIFTNLSSCHPEKTFILSVYPIGRKFSGFDKIKHELCLTHEAEIFFAETSL